MTDSSAVPRIADRLAGQFRLTLESPPSESEAVLRGGSQLRTRLLGGWFISPDHLPRRVHVRTVPEADGTRRVEVRVDDALGPIAVRDRRFSRRYEAAADSVFATVERAL